MNDVLPFGIATWGIPFFFEALRNGRSWKVWAWGGASFALIAGGLFLSPERGGAAAAALFAWGAAAAGPWTFRRVRRRSERLFRARLRSLRAPARRAAEGQRDRRAALQTAQAHLDRMQNRFALVQTMATQLDTDGILRSLGELWTGISHVRRCLLLQRRPNGNWASAFAHGVERPEGWALFMNDHPSLARSKRARRFATLEKFPDLVAMGAGTPLLLVPFAWGEDVMALGAVELDAEASEEVWEGFHVERKLVSIGLRRAFLYDLMSERSRHDSLTGAFLRRPFLERVEEALRKHRRYRTPFALALFDLDRFKSLNDRFGHLAGDRALVHLARTARALALPGVTLGRLGGDEFAFILEFPSLEKSLAWVDGFRQEVRRAPPQEGGEALPVTVSVGLAAAPLEALTAEEFLQRADRALYAAKEGGRDRVAVYGEDKAGAD